MRWQTTRFYILLLLVALGGAAVAQDAPDPEAVAALLERPPDERFVLGQVVVKLAGPEGDAIDTQILEARVAEAGLEEGPMVASGGALVYRIDLARAAAMDAIDLREETLAAVETMRADPNVEWAEPNYLYQIGLEPDDTRYGEQWHYFDNGGGAGQSPGGIGLPEVWDTDRGAASVVVAVIDTGILPFHPDIAGSPNLLPGFDMISLFGQGGDPDVANDGDGRDPDPTDPGDAVAAGECPGSPPNPARGNSWHGTHVAGTVGVGNTDNGVGIAGVNWDVGIVPVRVLGKCGGTTIDIADAIRWAAGLSVPGVPANANPADVINLSLGGPGACATSQVQQNAIADAVAAGVTVVVSAGNSAQDAANFSPASCPDVITVAAGDLRGRLVNRYSNFGATVEILAPGGDVQRDDNSDNNPDGVLSLVDPTSGTYAFYNGTSMAAPHVAGVAALMLSVDDTLTPAQILGFLQSTARPRSATECSRPCGAGLLDAAAALDAVRGGSTLRLTPSTVEVDENQTATLIATTSPPLPGVAVSFSSADPTIATVTATALSDAAGRARATVTGVAAGETTVTASAAGVSDSAVVRVQPLSAASSRTALVFAALLLAAGLIWALARRRGAAGG